MRCSNKESDETRFPSLLNSIFVFLDTRLVGISDQYARQSSDLGQSSSGIRKYDDKFICIALHWENVAQSLWRCWRERSRLGEGGVGLLWSRNPVLEGRHGWKVTPLTKNTKKDDILNLGNQWHLLYRMRMATRTRFWLAGKMCTPRSVEEVQVQVEQMLPLSTSSLGPALLSSSLPGSGSRWGEVFSNFEAQPRA